jgi:hypothetical protein
MAQLLRRRSCLTSALVLGLLIALSSCQAHVARESPPTAIEDSSFRLVPAYIVAVNVPSGAAEKVLREITNSVPLQYGNYDRVAFRSATGLEQFRPLNGSKAGKQAEITEVPTTRITFAIPQDSETLRRVIAAVRNAHPYEEPVVQVAAGWMSQAKHENEVSNPNRWWNQKPAKEPPSSERR